MKAFDLGRQVCQHIVGMRPKSIGETPEPRDPQTEPKIEENETRLLHQEFLMKPNSTVFDFTQENHLQINDFVRFECGEVVEDELAAM